MTYDKCEILVVGAGPAGLSAANCCMHEGFDVLVVDSGGGLESRDRSIPSHCVQGVGGSGLFSDGKLSYYPSSHAMWALPSKHILEAGFNWLHALISDMVSPMPSFPKMSFSVDWHHNLSTSEFSEKKYDSIQLNESQSFNLIKRLSVPISHKLLLNTNISNVSTHKDGYIVEVINDNGARNIYCDQIIFAGGRFGGKTLKRLLPDLATTFRRFEYGVRIEQNEDDFFLKNTESIDTKLKLGSDDRQIEWRTFCCCRNGVVMLTENDESISTYSGSTWGDSTLSNVGFNVRIKGADLFNGCKVEIDNLIEGKIQPFKMNLDEFEQQLNVGMFGQKLDDKMREGITRLKKQFAIKNALIYGPCIEGTGIYPWLSSNLETMLRGIYVVGDSTGIFRGLLPSLISGYYAAKNACMRKHTAEKQVVSGVAIKRSSIQTLPMVFTAQSKKFFYCRDVICEYVLQHKMLPINPFRVFDYFLGDRVSRDLIRRGNNHLVRACDELWVFGPIADGVLFEVIYAINIGKPIRFFSIGTYAKEIKPVTNIKDIQFEPEVHAARQKREKLLKEIEVAFSAYQIYGPQLELALD